MKILKPLAVLLFCSLFLDLFGIPKIQPNTTFPVSENYDLRGKELKLPTGVTLDFKGGVFITVALLAVKQKSQERIITYLEMLK